MVIIDDMNQSLFNFFALDNLHQSRNIRSFRVTNVDLHLGQEQMSAQMPMPMMLGPPYGGADAM